MNENTQKIEEDIRKLLSANLKVNRERVDDSFLNEELNYKKNVKDKEFDLFLKDHDLDYKDYMNNRGKYSLVNDKEFKTNKERIKNKDGIKKEDYSHAAPKGGVLPEYKTFMSGAKKGGENISVLLESVYKQLREYKEEISKLENVIKGLNRERGLAIEDFEDMKKKSSKLLSHNNELVRIEKDYILKLKILKKKFKNIFLLKNDFELKYLNLLKKEEEQESQQKYYLEHLKEKNLDLEKKTRILKELEKEIEIKNNKINEDMTVIEDLKVKNESKNKTIVYLNKEINENIDKDMKEKADYYEKLYKSVEDHNKYLSNQLNDLINKEKADVYSDYDDINKNFENLKLNDYKTDDTLIYKEKPGEFDKEREEGKRVKKEGVINHRYNDLDDSMVDERYRKIYENELNQERKYREEYGVGLRNRKMDFDDICNETIDLDKEFDNIDKKRDYMDDEHLKQKEEKDTDGFMIRKHRFTNDYENFKRKTVNDRVYNNPKLQRVDDPINNRDIRSMGDRNNPKLQRVDDPINNRDIRSMGDRNYPNEQRVDDPIINCDIRNMDDRNYPNEQRDNRASKVNMVDNHNNNVSKNHYNNDPSKKYLDDHRNKHENGQYINRPTNYDKGDIDDHRNKHENGQYINRPTHYDEGDRDRLDDHRNKPENEQPNNHNRPSNLYEPLGNPSHKLNNPYNTYNTHRYAADDNLPYNTHKLNNSEYFSLKGNKTFSEYSQSKEVKSKKLKKQIKEMEKKLNKKEKIILKNEMEIKNKEEKMFEMATEVRRLLLKNKNIEDDKIVLKKLDDLVKENKKVNNLFYNLKKNNDYENDDVSLLRERRKNRNRNIIRENNDYESDDVILTRERRKNRNQNIIKENNDYENDDVSLTRERRKNKHKNIIKENNDEFIRDYNTFREDKQVNLNNKQEDAIKKESLFKGIGTGIRNFASNFIGMGERNDLTSFHTPLNENMGYFKQRDHNLNHDYNLNETVTKEESLYNFHTAIGKPFEVSKEEERNEKEFRKIDNQNINEMKQMKQAIDNNEINFSFFTEENEIKENKKAREKVKEKDLKKMQSNKGNSDNEDYKNNNLKELRQVKKAIENNEIDISFLQNEKEKEMDDIELESVSTNLSFKNMIKKTENLQNKFEKMEKELNKYEENDNNDQLKTLNLTHLNLENDPDVY